MIIDSFEAVIEANRNRKGTLFLRNLLKEVIQLYTLNYVFSSSFGKDFIFKGGTCLRFCFGLPRLSEDLDFDIKNYSRFSLTDFTGQLTAYFVSDLQFPRFRLKVAGNKRQIFLQFPVMKQLGLVKEKGQSDLLFVRIDLSPTASLIYQEEISLKTASDFSFIIKRYSLTDLFAGKIAAIIQRTFRKGRGDLITFKGRDYFDLIWFLEKGVTPDFKRITDITGIKGKKEILKELDQRVMAVKEEYLREDLIPFFEDVKFVEIFAGNFKELYQGSRKQLTIGKRVA